MEVFGVALLAFVILVLFTTYIAVGYFGRDTPFLRLISGRQRRRDHAGTSGLGATFTLVPLFVLTVGVLQAALVVGMLTLELPINRLACAIEIVAAVVWIGYLASLPRQAPFRHGDD